MHKCSHIIPNVFGYHWNMFLRQLGLKLVMAGPKLHKFHSISVKMLMSKRSAGLRKRKEKGCALDAHIAAKIII